ncbi:hypothetical protein LWI28_026728 [Acer negundo]|uniref:Uncharacterized protein n=1 Tax=Acer negundo TaxID=4023 RepID=A0AAD5IN67_ACENE|nr:hypothetical protein LWI28_026728 [Acer negundo]
MLGGLEFSGIHWLAFPKAGVKSRFIVPYGNKCGPATSSAAFPATLPISSPPSSVSPAANLGVLLEPSRPTTTPPLTPDKSQPSPSTTLLVLLAKHSLFSEMTVRAARQDDQTQETEDLVKTMIGLEEGGGVPATPGVLGTGEVQVEAITNATDGTGGKD